MFDIIELSRVCPINPYNRWATVSVFANKIRIGLHAIQEMVYIEGDNKQHAMSLNGCFTLYLHFTEYMYYVHSPDSVHKISINQVGCQFNVTECLVSWHSFDIDG